MRRWILTTSGPCPLTNIHDSMCSRNVNVGSTNMTGFKFTNSPNIQLSFRDFPDTDGRVADDHGPPGSAQSVQLLDLRGFEGDRVNLKIRNITSKFCSI